MDHPFTRLTEAREGLAGARDREAQVQRKVGEIEGRISELEGEISSLGAGARHRDLDAILSGSVEPDEKELRKRVERTSILRAQIADLREHVSALTTARTGLQRSAEGLEQSVFAAETACLRLIEGDLLERYHQEIRRLIAEVLTPMRAVVRALGDHGAESDAAVILGQTRLPAINASAGAGSPGRFDLWVNGPYIVEGALPEDLLSLAQEPVSAVVTRLIDGLGQSPEVSPDHSKS